MSARAAAVRSALLWRLRQHGPSATEELEQVMPTITRYDPFKHQAVQVVSRFELYDTLRALEDQGLILGTRHPAGIMWRLAPAAIDDALSAAFWDLVGPLTPDTSSVLRWTEEGR